MSMGIKPRYLFMALIVVGGLYALGVSVGTLVFVFVLAFMASMHLGHGGGAGGCGGHLQSKPASETSQTLSRHHPLLARGTAATADPVPTALACNPTSSRWRPSPLRRPSERCAPTLSNVVVAFHSFPDRPRSRRSEDLGP